MSCGVTRSAIGNRRTFRFSRVYEERTTGSACHARPASSVSPVARRVRRLPSTLLWLHRRRAPIPSVCAARNQQRVMSHHATQYLIVKHPLKLNPTHGGLPPSTRLIERRARRTVWCPSRNANANPNPQLPSLNAATSSKRIPRPRNIPPNEHLATSLKPTSRTGTVLSAAALPDAGREECHR
jgi:hypothetical protein